MPVSCTRTGAWVLGRCSVCRSWTARSCRSDSAACSPCRSRNNFSFCAVQDHCAVRKPWSVRCGSPARAAPSPSSCRNRQIPRESNRHPAPNLTPNQRSESVSGARKTSPALPSSLWQDLFHKRFFNSSLEVTALRTGTRLAKLARAVTPDRLSCHWLKGHKSLAGGSSGSFWRWKSTVAVEKRAQNRLQGCIMLHNVKHKLCPGQSAGLYWYGHFKSWTAAKNHFTAYLCNKWWE